MDWLELSLNVRTGDLQTAADIANMAVPYGIYIEDYSDLEQGAQEIAHIDLIDEQLLAKDRRHAVIHIYFSSEENCAEAAAYVKERLGAAGIDFTVRRDTINEQQWADNWKQFFKCTPVGERLVICPSWESYENPGGKTVLRIDPGAAFGTGTHATTRMCLELLQQCMQGGEQVLDIGCGSGIIGIAAALLGAKQVVGVDIDPVAVKVARENAAVNHVETTARFTEGDLTEHVTGTFDVVCANIVADAIISLAGTVGAYLADGGVFICSGIIDLRKEEVLAALHSSGFTVARAAETGNWCAFAVKRLEK